MEEGNVIWMTTIKSLFVIMKTSTSSSVMDGILHFAMIITQRMRDVINKVPFLTTLNMVMMLMMKMEFIATIINCIIKCMTLCNHHHAKNGRCYQQSALLTTWGEGTRSQINLVLTTTVRFATNTILVNWPCVHNNNVAMVKIPINTILADWFCVQQQCNSKIGSQYNTCKR